MLWFWTIQVKIKEKFVKTHIYRFHVIFSTFSDEEDQAKTDSSEESEIEFEMGPAETLAKLIDNRFLELDIDNQIQMGIDNVSTR